MSDDAMTHAEILQVFEDHKHLPIDLSRWLNAVAELHALLQLPSARAEIESLRMRYGAAGAVMCYMTADQRRIAEPKFAAVEKEMRRFAQ